jgi:putative oxidoreductase
MPTFMDWIALFRRFMRKIAAVLAWVPPTVARLTLGWIFLQSGWGKLHDLPKVIGYFSDLGIPAPQIQAPLAAGTEFLVGVLMLLGLFTRFASLPLIGVMIVAILTAKRDDIHELSDLFAQAEYLYIVLALWLGAYGAGPLSLDAVLARRMDRGDRPIKQAVPIPLAG